MGALHRNNIVPFPPMATDARLLEPGNDSQQLFAMIGICDQLRECLAELQSLCRDTGLIDDRGGETPANI